MWDNYERYDCGMHEGVMPMQVQYTMAGYVFNGTIFRITMVL